jgi:hypothetical protein
MQLGLEIAVDSHIVIIRKGTHAGMPVSRNECHVRKGGLQTRQDGCQDRYPHLPDGGLPSRVNSHHEETIIIMMASLEKMGVMMETNQEEVKTMDLEENPEEI